MEGMQDEEAMKVIDEKMKEAYTRIPPRIKN